MCEYEFIYEFKYKNSLTGHFLVHPKSDVFFMNSYINSWFSMNSYMNSDMNSFLDTSWYTRFHSFSWNHARYHGLWPLFMGEIILEIMSEDFRETYREKFSEIMEDLYEFLNESSLNSWALCADAPYLTGPGHSAAAALEPRASLSACLCRATVPIPATFVLSHTQYLLPAHLAFHQLES